MALQEIMKEDLEGTVALT